MEQTKELKSLFDSQVKIYEEAIAEQRKRGNKKAAKELKEKKIYFKDISSLALQLTEHYITNV